MAENQQNRDNYFFRPGGKVRLCACTNIPVLGQVTRHVSKLFCSWEQPYFAQRQVVRGDKLMLLHGLSDWNRAQAL